MKLARRLLIVFAVVGTALSACTPPPTVTTEPGKRAWQSLEVLKRVEEVQIAAIDAEKTGAVRAQYAKIVIDFATVAAKTCKVYSVGWEKALATAYREAKAKLPQDVIEKSPLSYILGVIEGVIMSLNGGVL